MLVKTHVICVHFFYNDKKNKIVIIIIIIKLNLNIFVYNFIINSFHLFYS